MNNHASFIFVPVHSWSIMNFWHTVICLAIFTTHLSSNSNAEDNLLSPAERRNLKLYRDLAKKSTDNVASIIKYDGYPTESHSVKTKDGYFLTCTRIPHGKDHFEATKEPILLSPALATTGGSWLSVSPKNAL
ncbi:unnamed protein product, partial [Allacma fusca]